MSIAAIILAAGASRRLGRPKQQIVIDGESLVARAARLAGEAGLGPVLVVIRPGGPLGHLLQQQGCDVLLNEQAEEGIASSIRHGVQAARMQRCSGAVLMSCDQPALAADHLRVLCAEPESITGSAYAGTVGIPAYFPASAFHDLLQLRGDRGARHLLSAARGIPAESLALDIDTEEDLARARALFEIERRC